MSEVTKEDPSKFGHKMGISPQYGAGYEDGYSQALTTAQAETAALRAEVERLRGDLASYAEAVVSCEGCGAPLFAGDEFIMGDDASGCWAVMTGNHKSAEGTPCFAYRVGKPCAHARQALKDRSHDGR